MSRGPALLFILILFLSAAAGSALAIGNTPIPNDEEIHRLVGGLGGGRATDLSRGAFAFDPRLDHDVGPATTP